MQQMQDALVVNSWFTIPFGYCECVSQELCHVEKLKIFWFFSNSRTDIKNCILWLMQDDYSQYYKFY
jgi:hypothetical protein